MLPVFSATRRRERVGDGLGDQGLATPGRAVEQDALGRLQLVLEEHVGVEVRQLDRVLDLIDLVVEPADVGVGDVGHLLEHELLDLRPREPLDEQTRARIHEHVVTGTQPLAEQLLADLADALLVGAPDDQRTVPARSSSLRTTTSPEMSAPRGEDDVERLVERDLLATLHVVELDLGMDGHAHLATGGEDVDGAVVVGAEVRAVRGRRHRELLDLFAQRGDVLAGFAEGGREPLVLRDGLGELALGLEDSLLERADTLRGVLEPAAEDDDLFLEASSSCPWRSPTWRSYSARRRSCSEATDATSSPSRPRAWALDAVRPLSHKRPPVGSDLTPAPARFR